jgi:hypothetical protein
VLPKKEEFIPLWMPIVAFALIVVAYIICFASGINVNPYYGAGVVGISGFFAVYCEYLKYCK